MICKGYANFISELNFISWRCLNHIDKCAGETVLQGCLGFSPKQDRFALFIICPPGEHAVQKLP